MQWGGKTNWKNIETDDIILVGSMIALNIYYFL